jgi:hypothetical protein
MVRTSENFEITLGPRSERSADELSAIRPSLPAHSILAIHHLHHPQHLSRLLRTKSFVVTISKVIIIVVALHLQVAEVPTKRISHNICLPILQINRAFFFLFFKIPSQSDLSSSVSSVCARRGVNPKATSLQAAFTSPVSVFSLLVPVPELGTSRFGTSERETRDMSLIDSALDPHPNTISSCGRRLVRKSRKLRCVLL